MKYLLKKEFSEYKDLLISGISDLYSRYKQFRNSLSWIEELPQKNRRIFSAYNLLLSIYITFITYFVYSSIFETRTSKIQACISSILLIVLIYHLILFFCGKILLIRTEINERQKPFNWTTVYLFSSACFIVLLISLVIYFPGETTYDVENQLNQVQQFRFDDWHPVIHTFIIWLIMKIGNHYALVILVQITFFSYAVGFLIATLESWGVKKKYLLFTGLLIILNPYTRSIMMIALKDSAFSILLTFLTSHTINIYLSNGKWFSKTSHIIWFAVCAGLASLVRHNGIFFTVPLLLLIVLFYVKKEWRVIPAALATLLIIVLIRFPLYACLNITHSNNTYSEAIGVPMTIMGDVFIQNPEALPEETKNFLREIASDEEWHQKYVLSEYNSIKFVHIDHTIDVVQNIPVKEFMQMTLNTLKADKLNALHAVRDLTYTVWGLRGDPNLINLADSKSLDKTTTLNKNLIIGMGVFDSFLLSIPVIKWIFGKTGWLILALLLAGIIACCRSGFKPLLLIIPSLVYDFGTMLLLCTPTDVRFFHFNVVITLPLILVLLFTKDREML